MNKKYLWFIFSVYLAITLIASFYHAPWRDEAQSWLIARDLSPLGIITQMPYEGTPPLWHFILSPLAHLGVPYTSQFIINYLIAAAAIFLILFFSPLPKSLKIILPFSFFFLFEYSVVARNYSLIVLAFYLIASFYKKRFDRPILYALLITFLAWSGIQTLGAAAILTLIFILDCLKQKYETKKYLVAIIIMILAQVAVIFILLPYPDQLYASLNFNGLNIFAQSLSLALLPFLDKPYVPPIYFWIIASAWLGLFFIILKTRQAKLIFLSTFAWMMFILLFKHFGYLRHFGLFLVVFIFSFWLDIYYQNLNYKKTKTVDLENIKIENRNLKNKKLIYFSAYAFLVISLIGSTGYSAYYFFSNRNTNFSGAREMAQYLKINKLSDETIVTYPAYAGTALLPYLPRQTFFQMEEGRWGTFMTWDSRSKYGPTLPYWFLKKNMVDYFSSLQNTPSSLLILTTLPLGKYDSQLLLLSQNKKPAITDEFFYLYRFNLSN